MRRPIVSAALLLAVAWPAAASAQYVSHARGPVWDRFTLEPYVGRYYDNAGGASSGFNDHGWMGGVRLGVALADRVRLVGDVGHAQVDRVARVGGTQEHTVFGSQNWLVAGGVELDVVPGDTRGSLSLLGGRAWRDLRQQEVVGPGAQPAPATGSPFNMIVPGFSIHQRIAPRADLKLGVQDYIFVGADPVSHNWALTAGLTIR
jgi:hypothetical protein